MNLLVFEFLTATGLQNPSITVEGEAMLEGLLRDLKDVHADYLISENSTIKFTALDTESMEKSGNGCKAINISENLSVWLDNNIRNYDACLPLAPEEDLILYELTKKLEENNVKTIGSSSDAVLTCSDKFQTYDLLKNNFPMVKSEKIFFRDLKNYKQILSGKKRKMVVKPADGVSCSGVQVVLSYADFIKASAHLKRLTRLPYFLLQDFIEGKSTSVSLLSTGETAIPLSLNLQNVQLNWGELHYKGGRVPFEHELSGKAREIAKTAVEYMGGLKGYVGVDLVLDETNQEVHILEINPRLTTSYVALRKLLNFNLGEAILEAVEGKLPSEINLNGSVTFFKEENHLVFENPEAN